MKNEAKAAINILFKDFSVFTRHMFSGLVAVFLFEIGKSGANTFADIEVVSDMKLSQGVCYAFAALVVGNLTYLLSRYVICASVMFLLHKKSHCKYSRGKTEGKSANYFEEIGRFAQYRWSKDFPPKLNEYLLGAWGWIHGIGSVAIVLIVIPVYFIILKRSPFYGCVEGICVTIGVALLLSSYLHHICLLLSMENIAYKEHIAHMERNGKKEDKEPVAEE